MNTAARAARRAEHAPHWEKRRAAARDWLAATPEVAVPALPAGFPAHNPIDHFIAARIAQAAADEEPLTRGTGGVDFFRDIKPILEAHCYSCHQGAKVKGGLRLDTRAAALHGGRGDGPAIVPGDAPASPLFQRITSTDSEEVMPAKGDRLPARDIALLERWIAEGAGWPEFPPGRRTLTPLADDLTFLRRVSLDTIGVVPSEAEIAAFLADSASARRERVIDRLLADPRAADHAMGYWLDVLAENPNLINPTLNNTGPFRWWLHESLLDHKPLDLLVTELLRLEGSERGGGPAGFGVATQNDVPAAAKGIIVAGAFLGVEMKCARCHDAPTHAAKQSELFQLAAMLEKKPLKVPATSSVPLDHLRIGGRTPLIEVTPRAGLGGRAGVALCAVRGRRHGRDHRRAARQFPRPPRRAHHRAAERALRPGDGEPPLAAPHGPRDRRDRGRLGEIRAHASRAAPLARPRARARRLRPARDCAAHPPLARLPARRRSRAGGAEPALRRARAAAHRR